MNIFHYIKNKFPLSKWGKQAFIQNARAGARLLDVGCGNRSPQYAKEWNPRIYYVGIDVGDYNNDRKSLAYADEYILSSADQFSQSILGLQGKFDAIVSSHNIEHCNNPMAVLDALCEKLADNGKLFLSFPSEQSVQFPRRKGTLNFYDDPTHQYVPNYAAILERLLKNGMYIVFARQQYRPSFWFAWGMVFEIFSKVFHRVLPGTWAFWGFESVIWAWKSSIKK